jgi:hypothetical protein
MEERIEVEDEVDDDDDDDDSSMKKKNKIKKTFSKECPI